MEKNLKVAIKGDGTKEYGKRIINYLEFLGARNRLNFDGINPHFWCITDPDFKPWIGAYESPPSGYTLITLDGTEKFDEQLLLLI